MYIITDHTQRTASWLKSAIVPNPNLKRSVSVEPTSSTSFDAVFE